MSRLQWYLIYTKPRAESTAEANLRNQGYEVCSPKISFAEKEETRTEPMFSRYIFTKNFPFPFLNITLATEDFLLPVAVHCKFFADAILMRLIDC